MPLAPETRYAERDGLHLAYQVLGDGERDIFYLSFPSMPIDLMWDDPLMAHGLRRLAGLGRLIACDGRGWGSSDRVDQRSLPALQAWMDDVGIVLDAVGSQQATLIGMNEIALPAMLFAASHPERVSGLVLVNATARFARDDDYPWGMPAHALDRWVENLERAVGGGDISRLYAPSRSDDELFVRWSNRAERLSTPPNVAAGQYSLFVHADVRGVLASIAAPTLVLYRRDNKVLRRGHAEYLAANIPAATLVEVPGGDNLWYSGDADALVDQIEAFLTGAPTARMPRERALATVMFTDIVSSTEHAAELGDMRWRAVLERYHELATTHISSFRGRLIKSTGDGTLATFDGPARAIECACSLRDAVEVTSLQLRVGVHTGEVELIGDDIGGIAVHIGSRVAGIAEPGEVLASAAVPPLVVGSGIEFEDRGNHELKGVPGAWRLYRVTASS